MWNGIEYRASRTKSPANVTDDEAVLLRALRTGRWWRREAMRVERDGGDQALAAGFHHAAEQCWSAALYWAWRSFSTERRAWRLPVLGVRLTKAQHRMIRDCCRNHPERGECEWLRLLAAHPPVGEPPPRSS